MPRPVIPPHEEYNPPIYRIPDRMTLWACYWTTLFIAVMFEAVLLAIPGFAWLMVSMFTLAGAGVFLAHWWKHLGEGVVYDT